MMIEIQCGKFSVGKKDLPDGIIGKIMLDIAFCQPDGCRDKKVYLELLEDTAKEIVDKVLSDRDLLES